MRDLEKALEGATKTSRMIEEMDRMHKSIMQPPWLEAMNRMQRQVEAISSMGVVDEMRRVNTWVTENKLVSVGEEIRRQLTLYDDVIGRSSLLTASAAMIFQFDLDVAEQISLSARVKEKPRLVKQQDDRMLRFTVLGEPSQKRKKPDEAARPRSDTHCDRVGRVVDICPEVHSLAHAFGIFARSRLSFSRQSPEHSSAPIRPLISWAAGNGS